MSGDSVLQTGGRSVPADWIDYNGHMMDAYYSVAFTEATEALLDHVGLGAAYRAQTGSGMYTVESHICFRASVRAGEQAALHLAPARLRFQAIARLPPDPAGIGLRGGDRRAHVPACRPGDRARDVHSAREPGGCQRARRAARAAADAGCGRPQHHDASVPLIIAAAGLDSRASCGPSSPHPAEVAGLVRAGRHRARWPG